MTNKEKRRYRVRDWRHYNVALVRRGSLTLWVEERAVDRWREGHPRVGRGRRRFYSDHAIAYALTLREVYGLPLRATQGLVASVLRLLGADLPEPHYSTLSRRAASLEVKLPRLSKGPLHLAVDSTGVKLYGEGEWKVRLHGADRRRTGRKLHLLIDHRTQEVLACSMTEQYVLDRGGSCRGCWMGSRARWPRSSATALTTSKAVTELSTGGARALGHPAEEARAGQGRAGVPRPRRGGAARS